MYLMSAAWASLAILLSALGALYTWFAWRSQGLRGLTRGTAITLLPIAAWLTGTLRLFAVIADWFAGWATGLLFSPSVILGTVLAVVSVALFGLSSRLGARTTRRSVRPGRGTPGQVPSSGGRTAPVDDELADIEAMLRKRGIS
ncbi:MAG: hypothetical protein LH468_02035 [Nocardioides sp.]|nr:hypothetical protein [Nocardioides sp.]